MYDNQNVFAKILRDEIPCKKFYEDPYILSFYDINPQAPQHLIAIPKLALKAFEDLLALDETRRAQFFSSLQHVIKKAMKDSAGYRLVTNSGDYQDVPHLHFHILMGKPTGSLN